MFDIERGTLWVLFKRYCGDVDIPKRLAHPHVLKHSCAHFILDAPDTDLVDYICAENEKSRQHFVVK